jgi:hypothetical protein
MIDVRTGPRARQRWSAQRRRTCGVGVTSALTEIEIRFTEQEVAQILWVLSEASDLAGATDAL